MAMSAQRKQKRLRQIFFRKTSITLLVQLFPAWLVNATIQLLRIHLTQQLIANCKLFRSNENLNV
ncbi:hypothetical protein HanRHA438_Chr08g0344141 [Helianthus annuus]|nr:hypothetical protein HanIR_Chr08g0359331 [Helianthus annuus]KAJ0897302.1 hypothetical protein HanRHA438_Chr08g0344141 [Helianthus annuus]